MRRNGARKESLHLGRGLPSGKQACSLPIQKAVDGFLDQNPNRTA